MFRGLVDLVSLPVVLARDKDLFKITIDTGATGGCRLCIFVPRNVDPETDKRTRGVVMHLHGGGWSMCVCVFVHNLLPLNFRVFRTEVAQRQKRRFADTWRIMWVASSLHRITERPQVRYNFA